MLVSNSRVATVSLFWAPSKATPHSDADSEEILVGQGPGAVRREVLLAHRLTFGERTRFALLALGRSRRRAASRILHSPFLRWRFGSPASDQLLIVPPELRTADPSFYREVQLGQFGLAGTIAVLGEHSPFDLEPPNPAWERSLHGFGWLRHLAAAGDEGAKEAARSLAVEWSIRHKRRTGVAGEAVVTARRLASWLTHASLLLEGADPKTYAALTRSLGTDLVRLSADWRDAPEGYPRLFSLIALLLSDLCVSGHDRQLAETERAFTAELQRQILPDGGHVSRNGSVLVDLLLDLLPLRQCFASRQRPPPASLGPTMQRMLTMIRTLRLGDGTLSRFNGVSIGIPAGLATVLAYDERQAPPMRLAKPSGYARLESHGTVLVADVGAPPPLELAGAAHAGCLSFELSDGTELVLVNGGAPGSTDTRWRAVARATASHNTLVLADTSSSRLIRHAALSGLIGAPPIRGPLHVRADVEEHGGNLELSAEHDGYVERYGLAHKRVLSLSGTGQRIVGIDKLYLQRPSRRPKEPLPFAIHFHVHPDATCQADGSGRAAIITLRSGGKWLLSVEGATLSIEDSTFFVDSAGPRAALQVVLRGSSLSESEVRWVLEAVSGTTDESSA